MNKRVFRLIGRLTCNTKRSINRTKTRRPARTLLHDCLHDFAQLTPTLVCDYLMKLYILCNLYYFKKSLPQALYGRVTLTTTCTHRCERAMSAIPLASKLECGNVVRSCASDVSAEIWNRISISQLHLGPPSLRVCSSYVSLIHTIALTCVISGAVLFIRTIRLFPTQ